MLESTPIRRAYETSARRLTALGGGARSHTALYRVHAGRRPRPECSKAGPCDNDRADLRLSVLLSCRYGLLCDVHSHTRHAWSKNTITFALQVFHAFHALLHNCRFNVGVLVGNPLVQAPFDALVVPALFEASVDLICELLRVSGKQLSAADDAEADEVDAEAQNEQPSARFQAQTSVERQGLNGCFACEITLIHVLVTDKHTCRSVGVSSRVGAASAETKSSLCYWVSERVLWRTTSDVTLVSRQRQTSAVDRDEEATFAAYTRIFAELGEYYVAQFIAQGTPEALEIVSVLVRRVRYCRSSLPNALVYKYCANSFRRRSV